MTNETELRECREALQDVVDEYLHWRSVNPHIKGGENFIKRLRDARHAPPAALAAYQRAFNAIDDLMEYRGMSKQQLADIAAGLAKAISAPPAAVGEDCHHYKLFKRSSVWMVSGQPCQSAAREIAERCMIALGLNSGDFRKRDEAIHGISETLGGMLDYVASLPPAEPLACEVLAMLKKYRVAASRMCDKWAEGDQAVKNELWKALHNLEVDALEIIERAEKAGL